MAQEAWMAALRPALSDRKGRALLISTPRGRNWFWHLWQRGNNPLIEDWASWQHATITNRIIEEKEIAEARDVLAESIFRQEYEAAFLEDSAAVFKRVREAATAPTDAQHTPGHRYIMGVDFGRYADFTAVAVLDADTATLVALERFNEIGGPFSGSASLDDGAGRWIRSTRRRTRWANRTSKPCVRWVCPWWPSP